MQSLIMDILWEKRESIEDFRSIYVKNLLKITTCSADIRVNAFKIAAVDSNLFPAGFNNIVATNVNYLATTMRMSILSYGKNIQNIALIAEDFDRNIAYYQHLIALKNILQHAGFTVIIASCFRNVAFVPPISNIDINILPMNEKHPTMINGKKIDFFLFNNDFSKTPPQYLHTLNVPSWPPIKLGWYKRRKSDHFRSLSHTMELFADHIACDPWLLNTYTADCSDIDFMTKTGFSCLHKQAQGLFKKIAIKYKQYGIQQDPYIVIKSDTGTYGMSIAVIRNTEEINQWNRKIRKKLASGKEGSRVDRVLLQEGVPSEEIWNKQTAESVLYASGGKILDIFYRYHAQKDNEGILNAMGMQFAPDIYKSMDKKMQYSMQIFSELVAFACHKEALRYAQ